MDFDVQAIVVTSADGFGNFVKWKGIDVIVQAPSGVVSDQLAVLWNNITTRITLSCLQNDKVDRRCNVVRVTDFHGTKGDSNRPNCLKTWKSIMARQDTGIIARGTEPATRAPDSFTCQHD